MNHSFNLNHKKKKIIMPITNVPEIPKISTNTLLKKARKNPSTNSSVVTLLPPFFGFEVVWHSSFLQKRGHIS